MNSHKRAHEQDEYDTEYPNKRQKLLHEDSQAAVFGIDDLIGVIASKLFDNELNNILAFALTSKRFNRVVSSKHFWEQHLDSNLLKLLPFDGDNISQGAFTYLVACSNEVMLNFRIKTAEKRIQQLQSRVSYAPILDDVNDLNFNRQTLDQFTLNRTLSEYAFWALKRVLSAMPYLPLKEVVRLIEERIPRKTSRFRIGSKEKYPFIVRTSSTSPVSFTFTWYSDTRNGFALVVARTTRDEGGQWIWKKILPDNKALLYVFNKPAEYWKNINFSVLLHDPVENTIDLQRLFVGQSIPVEEFMNQVLQSHRELSSFVVLEDKRDILFRTPEPRTLCSFSESSFADSGIITLVMEKLLTSIPDLRNLPAVSKEHRKIVFSRSTWLNLGFSDRLKHYNDFISQNTFNHLCALIRQDMTSAELSKFHGQLSLLEDICQDRLKELQLTSAEQRDIEDHIVVQFILEGFKAEKRSTLDELQDYEEEEYL
jgi:hypothetical protein